MANEPERPIEKLLRAAAQKRRDQAGGPFELHPATRRLLQGEVARRFVKPQSERRSFWLLLAQLWPRLAWGVAILAVLGVVVWLVIPSSPGDRSAALLARNERMREAAPAKKSQAPESTSAVTVPAPATEAPPREDMAAAYADRSQGERPSAAPQPGKVQEQLAKSSPRQAAANEPVDKMLPAAGPESVDLKKASEAAPPASGRALAQAPARPVGGASERRYGFSGGPVQPGTPAAPAAAPPTVGVTTSPASAVAADESSSLRDAEAGKQTLAYKSVTDAASANRLRAVPTPAGALGTPYAAPVKAEKSPRVAQRFAQVTTGQKAKLALDDEATAAHPVLASFQVEQSGSELRIVDGDGSVYSGYVQLANTTRASNGGLNERALGTEAIRAPKDAVAEKPAARRESEQLAQQTYFFRVTGTNRTLHKNVVFTGSLLPGISTNKAWLAKTNLGVVRDSDGFQSSSVSTPAVPLINTRISGKVVVGNGKGVDINAEPTGP